MSRFSRRSFLTSTVRGAAGMGGAAALISTSGAARGTQPGGSAPAVRGSGRYPVVIASGNGLTSRNGGDVSCVEQAFNRLTAGADVLDALIEGVNIVELDPEDTSVGYGGLPDADGVVTLDACCMHGRKRRAGGVACLEGVRTPSLVARAVADNTDHHLLVGDGAQRFARNMGFAIEDDLNTPASRALWLEWKRRTDPGHYPDPRERAEAGYRAGREMVAAGLVDAESYFGTINCNGLSPGGDLAGVTTTSGLAWKIPGRVGDSPILGAGLYVDNDAGAAGSTGRGEANLYSLASFLVVEFLRQGMHPKDAGIATLKRIAAATVEPRLLNDAGRPDFNVNFYVLAASGAHAGVAFYGGPDRNYAVCDENGPRHVPIEGLYG